MQSPDIAPHNGDDYIQDVIATLSHVFDGVAL